MSKPDEDILGGMVLVVVAALVILGILFGITSCNKKPVPATVDSNVVFAKNKVVGKWKSDKHVIEFTTGAHAVIDGKFTYYEFFGHGFSSKIYLHLGRKKTNEFTFECTEDELILVYSRQCGWQTDIDSDDKLSSYEGRYQRIGKATTTAKNPDDKLTKLKEQLDACSKQHEKLKAVLGKMDQDKQDIVQQLKGLGITKKEDIKGNHRAEVLAQELLEMSKEHERVQKSYEEIAFKVTQIGSILRRIERQASIEGTTVSDKELDEMLVDIGDKLGPEDSKPVKSMEMDEVLKKELK
ncbi:MAG: hypothetical protein M0R80_07915 [Proteobacteria bacterium]|jgi:hypothetical protein|nr:hypothetical protein [Pseudomonadota bacterium]